LSKKNLGSSIDDFPKKEVIFEEVHRESPTSIATNLGNTGDEDIPF